MLSIRKEQPNRDFKCVRWSNSPHVGHLKKHGEEYRQHILEFLARQLNSAEISQKRVREESIAAAAAVRN